MVLFTSGTTGRSKGCVLSHRYLLHHAETIVEQFRITGADTLYSPFPQFHADATYLTVLPALPTGCSTAISERFSGHLGSGVASSPNLMFVVDSR